MNWINDYKNKSEFDTTDNKKDYLQYFCKLEGTEPKEITIKSTGNKAYVTKVLVTVQKNLSNNPVWEPKLFFIFGSELDDLVRAYRENKVCKFGYTEKGFIKIYLEA